MQCYYKHKTFFSNFSLVFLCEYGSLKTLKRYIKIKGHILSLALIFNLHLKVFDFIFTLILNTNMFSMEVVCAIQIGLSVCNFISYKI